MRYLEIPAPRPLARFIECFWSLTGTPGHLSSPPERILPDGCIELIVNLADPFRRCHEDGTRETQPLLFVVGQMERYLLVEPTGCVDLLGVRFRPAGALPFLRLPAHELSGRYVSLDALSPRLSGAITDRLYVIPTIATRLSALEGVLLAWIRDARPPDAYCEEAVRWILARRGRDSICGLTRHLGISERMLERRFDESVGLSPKLFSRIIRFQSVFQSAQQAGPLNWAAVAADCGYYDQAHFIRDFREFSGQSPAELFSQAAPLTESFTRASRASDLYNTRAG